MTLFANYNENRNEENKRAFQEYARTFVSEFEANKESNILFIKDNQVLMTYEYAKALDNFIVLGKEISDVNGVCVNGSDTYSILYKVFNQLLQNAKEDLMTNNKLYLDCFDKFNEVRNKMIGYKWIELFISFSIICFVYHFIIPLIFKDGSTISMKLFHMSSCDKDGYHVGMVSMLLKFVSEYITFLNVVFIIVTFLYNTNSRIFLQYKIFDLIPMTVIYAISILYLIVSLAFTSFKSMNYQSLSDKISNQILKDTRE